MYHQFPKTQPFRNMWIERCRRAGKWNPNSCHICSIHFQEDDYRKETSYEPLNLPGKRRLKPTGNYVSFYYKHLILFHYITLYK